MILIQVIGAVTLLCIAFAALRGSVRFLRGLAEYERRQVQQALMINFGGPLAPMYAHERHHHTRSF